jgi:hypothetical protein
VEYFKSPVNDRMRHELQVLERMVLGMTPTRWVIAMTKVRLTKPSPAASFTTKSDKKLAPCCKVVLELNGPWVGTFFKYVNVVERDEIACVSVYQGITSRRGCLVF